VVNLRNVLPVVWADTTDKVIPYTQSLDLVQELRRLKLDVVYTQTSGAGNMPPPDVLRRDYQTLRARVRQLYPRHLSIQSDRPDSIFNRVDWIQVYQELDPGPPVSLRLSHGAGPLQFYTYAYSLEAVRNGNTIDISTTNVLSLRLYFNDQMVDFSKPVKVIVNKKTRFDGMLKQSVTEMLLDQLFLGRGWRYYTAVLDLDLGNSTATVETGGPTTQMATAPATRPGGGEIILYNPDGTIKRIIHTP
jgi:hypothetical protein